MDEVVGMGMFPVNKDRKMNEAAMKGRDPTGEGCSMLYMWPSVKELRWLKNPSA